MADRPARAQSPHTYRRLFWPRLEFAAWLEDVDLAGGFVLPTVCFHIGKVWVLPLFRRSTRLAIAAVFAFSAEKPQRCRTERCGRCVAWHCRENLTPGSFCFSQYGFLRSEFTCPSAILLPGFRTVLHALRHALRSRSSLFYSSFPMCEMLIIANVAVYLVYYFSSLFPQSGYEFFQALSLTPGTWARQDLAN